MTPRRVARAQPFTANRDLTTPPLTLCISAEDKSLLVETFGGYLKKTMTDALGDHPHVGEIRGEGMICAVELVRDRDNRVFFDPADKIAPQIAASIASHGVIARAMPQGDIMGFAPPFCLTRQEADQIVETMVKAVKSTLG